MFMKEKEVANMSRLLYADLYRMYCKKRFWLFVASMIVLALMFIIMQYTAMDYVVSLDRVLFLPMSFYGVVIAALISLFVGDDFSDGVIRNKLIAGRHRSSIYMSNLVACWTACLTIYFFTIITTVGVGIHFFENNVTLENLFVFLILGLFTCMALGSVFCMLSMLLANKATSVMVCMGLAFCMLFLCLHTNQILMQQEYKNGVLNPHFVNGIWRVLYGILHDINPMGQVAQLSAMEYFNSFRWICCDVFWVLVGVVFGNIVFQRKNIT